MLLNHVVSPVDGRFQEATFLVNAITIRLDIPVYLRSPLVIDRSSSPMRVFFLENDLIPVQRTYNVIRTTH